MQLQAILGVGCLALALLYGFRGLGALLAGRMMVISRMVRPARKVIVVGRRAQAIGVLLIIVALVIALAGYLLLTGQSAVIAIVLCLGSLFFATLFESAATVDA